MRIHLVEPDGGGGMIHYAYQLATALARSGAEVTLITGRHYELRHLPHEFRVEARLRLWPAVGNAAIRHRGLSSLWHGVYRRLRRALRGLRFAREWHRLTEYLLVERPDVVQFATIRFPFQFLSLRRLRRAGIVLTQICHEFEPRERSRLTRYLNRRMASAGYGLFDRVYLHGAETRERFHQCFDVSRGRTATILHGDESMFLDLAGEEGSSAPPFHVDPTVPVALFFGGLRPSKGLPDLIEAWGLAAEEVDGLLVICGKPAGYDPARLERLARDHDVARRTIISPEYVPLERVAAVFEIADVVVLPYRSATGSGVLQLAHAFGKPVIATSKGSLVDDVRHGRTGLLVEAGDPQALARALVKILGDPAEARRMGLAARSAVRDHDWEPIARGIAADYQELLR